MTTIPQSAREVSSEWLTSVLCNDSGLEHGRIRVWNLRVDDSGQHGFLSSVLRAQCSIDGADMKIFGKFSPVRVEYQEVLAATASHVTEIQCYKELFPRLRDFEDQLGHCGDNGSDRLPRLDSFLPRFFCGQTDSNAVAYFLVMEDLAPEYSMASFNNGLSSVQLKSAMRCLGHFHALGYAFLKSLSGTEKTEGEPIPFLNTFFKGDHTMISMFEEKREAVLADLEKEKDGELLKNKVETLRQSLKERRASSETKEQRFLIHGDMWANNILFNSSDQCKFLDWQFATTGSVFMDIGTLALISMAPEDTRKELNDLLAVYYNSFSLFCQQTKTQCPWSEGQFMTVAVREAAFEACIWCLLSFDLIERHPNLRARLLWLLRDILKL